MVCSQAEDLRPAFATSGTNGKVDILESLVNLVADVGRVVAASSRVSST